MFQFIWLNLMLIVISVGLTKTAIVVYAISSLLILFIQMNINLLITDSFRDLRKGKPLKADFHVLFDKNQNMTRINMIAAFLIHSVLIITQLNSYFALIVTLLAFIARFYTTFRMEKLLNV